jgi:hypothetical protein
MKSFSRIALLFASLFLADAALAQQDAGDKVWAEIKKLDWKFGPTQGDIAAVASIGVPKDSVFLGSVGSKRFLELNGTVVTAATPSHRGV